MKRDMKLFLDSGAFTANSKGITIDIDEYIEYVQKNKDLFDYCFTLDVIGDGKASYHNWKRIRKAGVNAVPVFHLGTDERWLKRYLRQTDYIAIGAIANLNTQQRILGLSRIWKEYLVDKDGWPIKKVHGLGLTSLKILLKFPWYSVDSASWLKFAAFGAITLPGLIQKGGNWQWDYYTLKGYAVSDQRVHEVKSGSSIFTYPPLIKEQYIKFIEERGFELGTIKGRIRRPPRNKKLREAEAKARKPQSLFNTPTDTTENEGQDWGLANHYYSRCRFNAKVWKELGARLPIWPRKLDFDNIPDERKEAQKEGERTHIYLVVSGKDHAASILAEPGNTEVLVSYVSLPEALFLMLKEFKEGKEWLHRVNPDLLAQLQILKEEINEHG